MQNKHSIQFLRRRKFLLVLPLLALPFLTLAFWALGGGKAVAQTNAANPTGMNLQLPEAKNNNDNGDKLSFYNKAQEDSLKRRQEMLNDPYYKNGLDTLAIPVNVAANPFSETPSKGLNPSPYHTALEPAEAKIYERLNALNKVVQQPYPSNKMEAMPLTKNSSAEAGAPGDVARLEELMQSMNEQGSENSELNGLETVLDKILDIQHPERVKERLKEKVPQDQSGKSLISTRPAKERDNTYFGSKQTASRKLNVIAKRNAFYSEDSDTIQQDVAANAIAAVIPEAQTLGTGATVKLRLTADMVVNGVLIKNGTAVYGEASLENERLLVKVSGVRYGNNLLPVSLSVYDLDGVAGIYIPGSLTRDVAKNSADQSLQTLEMLSLDPSLKAQATSAGVQAVKSLLSKNAKRITVRLKAGYRVLLKNNSSDN